MDPQPTTCKKLYDKALEWGWQDELNTGDTRILTHKLSGQQISVPGPHLDGFASVIRVTEIIRVTTNGDEDKFWNGPKQGSKPAVEPKSKKSDGISRVNGNADRAFSYLVNHPRREVHVSEIANALKITNVAASGACQTVLRRGQCHRPKHGYYRYDPPIGAPAEFAVGGPVAPPPAPSPVVVEQGPVTLSIGPELTVMRPSTGTTVTYPVPDVLDELDIDAVLDLLLPSGFRAKDLAAIRKWQEATREMIRTVKSG